MTRPVFNTLEFTKTRFVRQPDNSSSGLLSGLIVAATAVLFSQDVQGATHVFDLAAGSTGGLSHSTVGTPLKTFGLNSLHTTGLTVSGAPSHNGNYTFPNFLTGGDGLMVLFNSGPRTGFFQDTDNTWVFDPALSHSITIFGKFSPADPGSITFQGQFTSGFTLYQYGAGSHEIYQLSPISVTLNPFGSPAQSFLNHFAPDGLIQNATISDLRFIPDAPVNASGSFSTTGGNFLGGKLSFDVVSTSSPVPDSGTGTALAATIGLIAFGIRNRRVQAAT